MFCARAFRALRVRALNVLGKSLKAAPVLASRPTNYY